MVKNKKIIIGLVLTFSIFSTSGVMAHNIDNDLIVVKNLDSVNNKENKIILGKPIIKDIETITEKTEDGTKITNVITVESDVPVRFISSSFYGPKGNIYGGGHGVKFNKIGDKEWQYKWTDTVSKYAPSGKYHYSNISVENESFLKSEKYDKDIEIDINNAEATEDKPIIKDIETITEKTEDGTKITNVITVESDVPVRFISSSFYGPKGNIYGGGHGVKFNKIGDKEWQYKWTDTVSKYAPSGKYHYSNISVENESFLKSEKYDKDIEIDINNAEATENKPIIKDISMKTKQCNECIKLINTITVESDVPVRFISSSFYGPKGNIYGGGHGVKFNKIGDKEWQYKWTDTVSKYAPSGKYYYSDISVENESFLESKKYDKAVFYNYDKSVYDNFVPLTGIKFKEKVINMVVNEEKELSYNIEPSNASNKEIVFSNIPTDMAEIKEGKIIAKKAGVFSLKVKTVCGDYSDVLYVNIESKEGEKNSQDSSSKDAEINSSANNYEKNTKSKNKYKKDYDKLKDIDSKIKEDKKENVKLVLKIDDLFLTKNGEKVEMDVAPVIKNNRTLLPVRFIIESMDGHIFWSEKDRKVTIVKDDTTIELWIDKKEIKVNGKIKEMDIAPEIINNRTYLPIRFIIENLPGSTVEWNELKREVTIKN